VIVLDHTISQHKQPKDHVVVYGLGSGRSARREAIDMTNGVDLLVSTTERLAEHVTSGHLSLEDTLAVVFDEADTLFMQPVQRQHVLALVTQLRAVMQRRHDTGAMISSKGRARIEKLHQASGPALSQDSASAAHQPIQHVFVSATISKEFAQMLLDNFKVRH
jgi:superfamily II DNA/RNA helicase